ncbi:hypothetical protein AB0E27_04680 [Streptomyces sparsogenes]|uniref:hypothetical protein n=1 Tax=Streptomyces sparsogenes TaxID=67365 RepID=UPI0033CCF88A
MSTDIYGCIETRHPCADEDWYDDEPWLYAMDLAPLYSGNDYTAFGCLFGVRNHAGWEPVAAGRGLPRDASAQVRGDYEQWAPLDALHSATWVTWQGASAQEGSGWSSTSSDLGRSATKASQSAKGESRRRCGRTEPWDRADADAGIVRASARGARRRGGGRVSVGRDAGVGAREVSRCRKPGHARKRHSCRSSSGPPSLSRSRCSTRWCSA